MSQAFLVVRSMGLEPIRLPIRPSNVRVCQFRHDRADLDFAAVDFPSWMQSAARGFAVQAHAIISSPL